MARAGKIHKGGRPKGIGNKTSFSACVTNSDRVKFAEWALKNYEKDVQLAKWVGDQMFGKAKESLELSGEVKFSLADIAMRALKKRETKKDS